MRIAVLYNLPDSESERCESEMAAELEVLETAKGVKKSLNDAGYEAVLVRCNRDSIFSLTKFDAVFNLAEGFENDLKAEPYVAGMLELLGLPYTGSPPGALERCRDKYLSKLILERENVPTPKFQLFRSEDEPFNLSYPVIIKPVLEDASIGITIDSLAENEDELRAKVGRVLKSYHQPALVEEYVDGREMNVALIMRKNTTEVLPISEIVFDLPENVPKILGFEAKWVEDSPLYQKTEPLCPAPLSPDLEKEMGHLARKACSVLGVKNYARVDFRVEDGRPFVIEVNPNPCINPCGSGFARAAKAARVDYAHLVLKILNAALEEKKLPSGRIPLRGDLAEKCDGFAWGELSFRRSNVMDAPLLFSWFSDLNLTKYMERSGSASKEELATSLLTSKDEDFVVLAGEKPFGFASLYNRTEYSCEISYLIGDFGFRGKGLGTEIVRAVVNHGFTRLGLRSIFASSATENISSIKSLESAGFNMVGVRRASFKWGGRCQDEMLFDIVPEDVRCASDRDFEVSKPDNSLQPCTSPYSPKIGI